MNSGFVLFLFVSFRCLYRGVRQGDIRFTKDQNNACNCSKKVMPFTVFFVLSVFCSFFFSS